MYFHLFALAFLLLNLTSKNCISMISNLNPIIKVYNRGFSVSMPDDGTVKFFAFHGKLNSPFYGREPGDYNGDVSDSIDGHFSYINNQASFELGDILHYWYFIQSNNQPYRSENRKYIVKSISPDSPEIGTRFTPATPKTTTESPQETTKMTTTPVTEVRIEITPNCVKSVTQANSADTCQGEVIFEENFDDNIINTTKWVMENHFSLDVEDAEFSSYEANSENVYIENGILNIVPKLRSNMIKYMRTGSLDFSLNCTYGFDFINYETACTRQAFGARILPPVISAKLSSRKSFYFTYGTVEIRAKLPKGDWIYPILNLEPMQYFYGRQYYESGLLRIAFIHGNEVLKTDGQDIDGRFLYGGAIVANTTESRTLYLKIKKHVNHLYKDFHTYKIVWSPQNIKIYLDNIEYGTILPGFKSDQNILHAYKWSSDIAPFDKDFSINLGVAVGGIRNFPDNSISGLNIRKPWSNYEPKAELDFWQKRNEWLATWNDDSKLQIDYIKVYAL